MATDLPESDALAPDPFAALGSPVRRRIMELLIEKGPCPVNTLVEELESTFQLRRPAVSEHLQVLRLARLVRDEKRGREHFYHIQPQSLTEVQLWLGKFERYWKQRMQALSDVLDEEEDQEPKKEK
ncbi:MAG: ArsR/SmtB family transcription factor [Candidatus Methylacidiphilales bacterium]|nr:metalloregulator ArsR/SmtB family transcription factor [Candidatus Methylacidiphilales bacterium]